MIKSKPKPSTPSPTTPKPITEPPAKATSKALPKLVRAAFVVRTFALVATRIPMKPAKPEQSAPTINDNAIIGEESGVLPLIPSKTAAISTKIARILYSALRNAIAPSAILFAITAIASVPTSCLETHADFQTVNRRAKTPNTGMASINVCPISTVLFLQLGNIIYMSIVKPIIN